MTLLARIEHARKSLAGLDAQMALLEKAGVFEHRANQLSEPAEQLEALTVPAKVLRDAGATIEALGSGKLNALRSMLKTVQKNYVDDPQTILDPIPNEDARPKLLEPLKHLPNVVRPALEQSWQRWIESRAAFINTEILELFAKVPSFSSDVARIRHLQEQLRLMSTTLPTSDDIPNRVLATAEGINNTWQRLTAEGLPDDVLLFLRAAGSREGANYEMLTEETMEWLERRALVRTLRIRLS